MNDKINFSELNFVRSDMKRKLIVIILLLICITSLSIIFLGQNRTNLSNSISKRSLESKKALATEEFIITHLVQDNSLIATDFKNNLSGNVFLSESIGLWLEYSALKEDEPLFNDAVIALKEYFLLQNGLVSWRIESEEQATMNALIDDLRIIHALFYFGELTGNEQYINLAEEIGQALTSLQVQNDTFVDFYDTEYNMTNDTLTLSYIVPEALQYLTRYEILHEKTYERMESLLKELPMKNNFFPKSYDVKESSFEFEDDIHFVDQLYIALHRERLDIQSEEFFSWIENEFYSKGKLFGRYDARTKLPTVSFESASVYALVILYSLEAENISLANDVYERMKTLQVNDSNSPYDKGYVDVANETTHSFDNLLPLLAERVLLDAKAHQQKK